MQTPRVLDLCTGSGCIAIAVPFTSASEYRSSAATASSRYEGFATVTLRVSPNSSGATLSQDF